MVAVALSTIILALVTSVFFAQNRMYENLTTRSEVQAGARAVIDLLSTELRQVGQGGMVLAREDSVAFRTPQVLGVVCGLDGGDAFTYLALDGAWPDSAEVSGYGVRVDGIWSYYDVTWGELYGASEGTARNRCVSGGLDASGTSATDFARLNDAGTTPSPLPTPGDPVMIYRELEYRLASSALADGARGLFRGSYGGTLVELATGMSDDAGFSYRLEGETAFSASVSTADLDRIVEVRVRASMVEWTPTPGDATPYGYDLTVDVPLRNAGS